MPLAVDTGDRCATCGCEFGEGVAAKTRGHLRSARTRVTPWYVWQCLGCNVRQRGYRLTHWLEMLLTRTYCDPRRARAISELVPRLVEAGLAPSDM